MRPDKVDLLTWAFLALILAEFQDGFLVSILYGLGMVFLASSALLHYHEFKRGARKVAEVYLTPPSEEEKP